MRVRPLGASALPLSRHLATSTTTTTPSSTDLTNFTNLAPAPSPALPPAPASALALLALLPPSPSRTLLCGHVSPAHADSHAALCGWLTHVRRASASTVFVTLRDISGIVQIVHTLPPPDSSDSDRAYHVALRELLLGLTQDTILRCSGTLNLRPVSSKNPQHSTGAVELHLAHLEVLNTCPSLPFSTFDPTPSSDPPDDLRLRHRHLDLRRTRVHRNLLVRSAILQSARTHLSRREQMLEIETPILVRSSPEGAREFLVPTRARARSTEQAQGQGQGQFYALAQSPQQYKQALMGAGFDRYFQVARCFRDEDGRKDRQPEFTQIDLELSFCTQPTLLHLLEGLILHVYRDVLGIPLAALYALVDSPYPVPSSLSRSLDPTTTTTTTAAAAAGKAPPFIFPVLTYAHAMALYGSDKPDTRFGMEIHRLSNESLRAAGWDLREGWVVEAFVVPSGAREVGRKDTKAWERELAEQRAGAAEVVVGVRVGEKEWEAWWKPGAESPLARLECLTPAAKAGSTRDLKLSDALKCAPGDLLAVSYRPARATGGSTTLGRARLLLATRMRRMGVPLPPPTPGVGVFGGFPRDCEVETRDGVTVRVKDGSVVLPDTAVGRGGRTLPVPHFLWVVEFPLFMPAEDEDAGAGAGGDASHGIASTHHPFTAPHPSSLHHLAPGGDPLQATALHHDLVLNGTELAGGSVRIHHAALQEHVLRSILALPPQQVESFRHLLTMLAQGCPPHGGAAVGLDRLVAEMCGEEGIRDVVAFPKVWSGKEGVMRDLSVGCPAGVEEARLEEYGVKWVGRGVGGDKENGLEGESESGGV
ncbi:hypothetical protein M427DRAFT_52858 [Gonapodya prolifera JEL478]|uniref:Aminoacyl-transfer RNA synthetases class-II family profile domain-containing protein n=1 Tax=Gonapodya prolifera (strain JEL478) TaxID=1344416 RepID=A0A139ARS6_GONPJ|nr:hypothetical protein M427DRAFT_52858 [Gonapodya prolifera JEL478]|eukprot:KXS19419.1 hypothetical protein M427DRAFT_52858 [Gonapodya prolifera JEL478]